MKYLTYLIKFDIITTDKILEFSICVCLEWSNMIYIIITIVVAVIGGLIASRFKMPAPFMIGALIAVAILSVTTDIAYMPSGIKSFTQSITGIFIGMRLRKKDISELKTLVLPAIVLILGFLSFTFLMGNILHYFYAMDYATAFLVVIPGGVVDVSLMAYDLNADPLVVSLIQTFRLSTVLVIFPSIIGLYKNRYPEENSTINVSSEDPIQSISFIDKLIPDKKTFKFIFTLLVGLSGGYVGYVLKLPAGSLSISMIFIVVMKMNSNRIELPMNFRWGAQALAGSIIGSGVTMTTLIGIKDIILPAITVMFGYIIANFVISYLMKKTGKVDRITAMFSSCPGGASDMALIAADIGGESPKIAVLQIVRQLSVLTLFPIFVKLLILIYQ